METGQATGISGTSQKLDGIDSAVSLVCALTNDGVAPGSYLLLDGVDMAVGALYLRRNFETVFAEENINIVAAHVRSEAAELAHG
jgi:hypothetical protein